MGEIVGKEGDGRGDNEGKRESDFFSQGAPQQGFEKQFQKGLKACWGGDTLSLLSKTPSYVLMNIC